jgi:sorting nexin-7/30
LWKEFSIHRKSHQGLLGRMSTSFHNLAAVYMMRQRTQEFEQVREYVTTLGEKLNSVDKVSQRLQKERQGMWRSNLLFLVNIRWF